MPRSPLVGNQGRSGAARPGSLPRPAGRRTGPASRSAALSLAALFGACTLPQPSAPPQPPIGPEIVVRLSEFGQPARDLLERVAAQCWLDGILRGAAMIVDRQTGRVVIVSDNENLLAADFLAPQDRQSRVRLSGPVIADPVKTQRLVETLDLAVRTGKTDCPIATG